MPDVLRFSAPRTVELINVPSPALAPNTVRVRTIVSGISAGTEMSAYRGSNPYLHGRWDPSAHLFVDEQSNDLAYPLDGWGYSEVGEVVEIGEITSPDVDLEVGDIVWGIWGHREENVIPVSMVSGQQMAEGVAPVVGTFNRVAAVAFNAILASEVSLGSTVVIVGQGVIGLLATRFAKQAGANVIAVEMSEKRGAMAQSAGADAVIIPSDSTALEIREVSGMPGGVDCAIELSGSYGGLQTALSAVCQDSIVAAAGFYQGAGNLVLGTEFHHNRIELRSSQIGAAPRHLQARWSRPRLHQTAGKLLEANCEFVESLVSHRFAFADASAAYELIDTQPSEIFQVVLEMK